MSKAAEKKAETEKKSDKSDDTPLVCQGCWKWSKFGRSCWVFWESKKICTHYEGAEGESYYHDISEKPMNVELLWI